MIIHEYSSSEVEYWIRTRNGSQFIAKNGIRNLNEGSDFPYPYSYNRVLIPHGKSILYARFEAPFIQLKLDLVNEDEGFKRIINENIKVTAIFSGLILIIILNVATFITTKNIENILYALYVFCLMHYLFWTTGVGGLVYGKYTEEFVINSALISIAMSTVFLGLFVHRFYDASKNLSKIVNIISFFVNRFVILVAVVLGFFSYIPLAAVGGMIQLSFILVISLHLAYKGLRSARLFLISFTPMFIGFLFITIVTVIGSRDLLALGLNLVLLGILIEIALLSMAIGDKFAQNLRDKNEIIEREGKSREHAFKQLSKIVYNHQIVKIRENYDLEDTMPTQMSMACVISFDIINSSKIRHIKSKEFFRNVFSRCNEIMMEGYDGNNHRAGAYRIKEMGDGFLCSVGYPFESLTDNPANDAIDLAFRFAKALTEESEILHSETPITCGIGIALDTITGFFPVSGTKEYDLYGPAIVLATRYEGMRKALFPNEKDRNILIIHETVYHSMDKDHRDTFTQIDLKARGLVVRDDAGADSSIKKLLTNLSMK